MDKVFKLIIIIFLIVSGSSLTIGCASSTLKENRGRECVKNYNNNFAYVLEADFKIVFKMDTIISTEIRYQCCASSMYTIKAMNSKFGECDQSINYENSIGELYIWENIDLLGNNKKYSVVAFGAENTIHDIYSSIMVFDQKGEDILKYNSEEKQRIIEFFSQSIRGG